MTFGELLAEWYAVHKRDLPWRHTRDPYLIWLSEIILQQTRVAQGLPYYTKFSETFPTVKDLAAASEEEVLRLWQGLGYYSRARNMHATARLIAEQYGGQFPTSYKELLKLKGIGPYTAAAIASFAFDEPVAVVDGNVFRVLARLFGISEDIASQKGKRIFAQRAQHLLLESIRFTPPSVYNQAIMEFGAIHCTPAAPNCPTCIFRHNCHAYRHRLQFQLPVKEKKTRLRNRNFLYWLFEHRGNVIVKQRGNGDIWQGLYDFPMTVTDEDATENPELLLQIYRKLASFLSLRRLAFGAVMKDFPLKISHISDVYKHRLTHQQLQVRFVRLTVLSEEFWEKLCTLPHVRAVRFECLEELPKPVLVANYLQEQFF